MGKWRSYSFWTCNISYLYKWICFLLNLVSLTQNKKMLAQKCFFKKVSWSVGIKGNPRTFYFKRKWTLVEYELLQTFPSVQLKDSPKNSRNPFMPTALRWNSYQNNLLVLDICDLMYLLSRNSGKLGLSLNEQGKKVSGEFFNNSNLAPWYFWCVYTYTYVY